MFKNYDGTTRVMLPSRVRINSLKAYALGIRDGWNQARCLSTSTNVDHLDTPGADAYDNLDRGINLGQVLRSPRQYERV